MKATIRLFSRAASLRVLSLSGLTLLTLALTSPGAVAGSNASKKHTSKPWTRLSWREDPLDRALIRASSIGHEAWHCEVSSGARSTREKRCPDDLGCDRLRSDPIAKECQAVSGQLVEHDRAACEGGQDGLAPPAHLRSFSMGPVEIISEQVEPVGPLLGTEQPADSGVHRHDAECSPQALFRNLLQPAEWSAHVLLVDDVVYEALLWLDDPGDALAQMPVRDGVEDGHDLPRGVRGAVGDSPCCEPPRDVEAVLG